MGIIKTVRLFYLFYTIYTLFVISVSDYKYIYALTGLFFVWATYFVFKLGFLSHDGELYVTRFSEEMKEASIHDSFPLSNISYWPVWKYYLFLIISWVCAVLTAKFYTGRDFALVIQGLRGGDSAYYSYQSYFLQNDIGVFSISKIPYILMLAFLVIITLWSIIGILLSNRKIGLWRFLYVIGVATAYAYFGAARGTNFETYVIFILFAYCLLQKVDGIFKVKSLKNILLVMIFGCLLVFIYRERIMDRGVVFQNIICPEITFESNSLMASMFPALVSIGLSVFSYLGYGIFCIGVTVSDICFATIENFMGFFMPFGHRIFNDTTLSNSLSHSISMGARWVPDFVKIIDLVGAIFYFVVVYLLGKFLWNLNRKKIPLLLKHIICVLVYIELLSIPVGNFITASSSNIIMVVFAILWLLQYGRVRFKFGKSRIEGNR